MTAIKHVLAAFLLVFILVLLGYYIRPENPVVIIICFVIIGFFVFNLTIRKSLAYRRYFESKYNLFTSKVRSEKVFDIPEHLMFEKIIEVIDNSEFKLIEADRGAYEILAITRMTLMSWGENLYIDFETKGGKTIMKCCSVTFFQIYSWGKNERNWDVLLNKIESSLTI
ncbi:hypothetical protein J8L85_04160 [Maribacter sp. MMG018]|uniref:hypothetical protein n=1 Tax=Maribacter sp. MMG018 TaxID=2822688 RepID=UPI001B36D6B2|nr:hypothetical protein [Maribacter sp. MMG018]MBQ4913617.1 hypothetical protein [Maribacter sp. MMG018]